MPETSSAASPSSRSHQPISLPPHPGGAGGDEQRLMSTTTAAEERRQKFLFISRRTTTTVFAKHDEDRLVGDTATKQQLLRRRQLSCPHYPEKSSSSNSIVVAPVPVEETHFEWNGMEGKEKEKNEVSNQWKGGSGGQQIGRFRSKDNIILNVAGPTGQNKIRLKIVW